jgi:hypothetical protein
MKRRRGWGPRWTAPLVLSACLLAAAGIGCGAGDRAPDAAAAADRFQSALERRDGGAACAELRDQTRSKLEQEEKKPCGRAILMLHLPRGGTVTATSVYVTNAVVRLSVGGTSYLDEGSDGWKVTAAGCKPTAPDLPYDCELED